MRNGHCFSGLGIYCLGDISVGRIPMYKQNHWEAVGIDGSMLYHAVSSALNKWLLPDCTQELGLEALRIDIGYIQGGLLRT